jgi:hypothetical protein
MNKEETEMQNIVMSAHANVDKLWRRYDKDHSGTVDADEIRQLLKDLHLDHSPEAVNRILTTYDLDKSGLLEKEELLEFLLATANDIKERNVPKPFMSDGGSRPYVPPYEGTLVVTFTFTPQRDEFPRATNLDELFKIVR